MIEPSAPWPGHQPGQYLRIGAEIDGVRHWRAYSITSDPDHPRNLVSITVKCVEEGKLSPFFSREIGQDSMVYLGEVEGTFGLPDPLPEKLLCVSAGSGITPIMAWSASSTASSALNDVVHVHSVRDEDDFIFADMLKGIADKNPGYDLRLHLSGDLGRLEPKGFDKACGSDWRDRHTFASGPGELLDVMTDYWEEETDPDRLSMERFQPRIGGDDAEAGEGGTIRFRVTEVDAESDGTAADPGRRRGGRRRAAVRLPPGHLPHLRRPPLPG